MTLYNCKAEGESYRITKFTADLDVESSYLTSHEACECPAGARSVCRHRIMLPRFIAYEATHGEAFFDYDRSVWIEASTEAALEESSLCSVCGCATQGEAALVDGAICCHPCADEIDRCKSSSANQECTGTSIEATLPPSSPAKFDRRF